MSAFRAKGRKVMEVKVPKSRGVWVNRSSKTRDRQTAKEYQLMVNTLGPEGKHAQDVLDRLVDKTLTVPPLYALWIQSKKNLRQLRKLLRNLDLSPLVEDWKAVMTGKSSDIGRDTALHYYAHVRGFIPKDKPFLRSEFTAEKATRWLQGLNVSPSTVRKSGTALRVFGTWLKARGVLKTNPMTELKLPAQSDPRCHYLETADAQRLADKQPLSYREFSALLAGSGIEVSVALNLRRRDVDVANREIRAAGTKTYTRDRVVRIAEWAWPYVMAAIEGKLPDVRLFDQIPDRWHARDVHAAAIEKLAEESLVFAGYTMRDQRHTYAVRAIRAGTPAELVARQLGHANAVLVLKVYGRFSPNQEERDRWERIADAQDKAAEKAKEKRA